MKQASRIIENPSIVSRLQQYLEQSTQQITDPSILETIKQMLSYRQDNAYNFFTTDLNSYFTSIWDHIVLENPDFEVLISQKMNEKQNNVEQDLNNQKLRIAIGMPLLPVDYDEESKNHRISLLRQQSDCLKKKISEINTNLEGDSEEAKDIKDMYAMLYSQDKIKEAEEFVRKNQEAQKQRKRKLEEQRKKEEQNLLKKQAQLKQQEQQLLRLRKQQVIQKQKQLHQRRQKQKQIREQRNTQYMRIKKSINEEPPLFQKIYEGYSKRYNQEENQRLNKMHSERKQYFQHVSLELLQKHEKEYEELRLKKQLQRKEKEEAAKSQTKSRAKVNSSFEITKYVDPKEIEKEQGKEKMEKMRQYRSIVKEKFQPKIDNQKRKELMNLIEEAELSKKRVKRVKLQNGSVMYEELKQTDPKMIGMEYLEIAKEMALKAREKKKQQKEVPVDLSKELKKPKNYLEELRRNRPKTFRTGFIDRRNMSYEDKVKKVMLESQKLAEMTKQNEMMLKFGKFKTSQEILACKQEIDQNYLNIVNMKLKLILSQQSNEDDRSLTESRK